MLDKLEGTDRNLIEILFQQFSVGNEENHEIIPSG
jgi:hypothetical protein